MGFSNPIVGAMGRLIREAIQSLNYVTGVSGWRITRDGEAEFASLTARGSVRAQAPDGSYVLVTTDPVAGALIEQRPPNSAGTTIVPARLAAGVNPNVSSSSGLTVQGPNIDGHGASRLVLSSGAYGRELSIDATYSWLTSKSGVSWVVNGDWEIAYEVAPNSFLIMFQVWGNDGTLTCGNVFCDDVSATGGTFTAAPTTGGRRMATGPGTAPKLHWSSVTATTNASGIATITHGAGFTPTRVLVGQNGASTSGALDVFAVDGSFTSTTFQIRAMNNGAVYTGNVGITYICCA